MRALARCAPLLCAAMLSQSVVTFAPAQQDALPQENAGAPAEAAARDEPGTVQSLGGGDQRLFVVDHEGTWSMHAENLATTELFRLWQEAGGPEVLYRMPVDRVFTISVHRLRAERILERVLDGYGYTLHYDAGGRLERVRVYSPEPSANFKTPRLVESLSGWRELETPAESATPPAGAAPENP